MRSRSSLAMMEQIIMLLVFALAAALCLQAFVKSDQMSRSSEARDRAITICQSAAEAIRQTKGDFPAAAALFGADRYDDDFFGQDYAPDWNRAEDTVRYSMGVARVETDVPGLGKAVVWLRDEAADGFNGIELVRLEVCWQEEVGERG